MTGEATLLDATSIARELRTVFAARAAEVDATASFPEENLADLRRAGLLGLLVPATAGGIGADLATVSAVAGELAAGCLSTALVWAMHTQQVDAVVRFGSPSLREVLLPRVAEGAYLASVTTEHGKGGHLLSSDAALSHSADDVEIVRDAPVVTGGRHADGFLVTMRDSPGANQQETTLVYANREQLELSATSGWDTLGMRGTASGGLKLRGSVPKSHVIGAPGRFREVALDSMIPLGHIGWASCWLGTARGALAALVGHVRSPRRSKDLDPRSPLVAERLARIRTDLEIVSAYLHRVVDEVTRARADGTPLGTSAQIHLNTLKVVAAEHTYRAVDRMVQLAGLGLGYRRDSAVPLERHLRDLRSASLNYSDDRLLVATGTLTLADSDVRLA
ncbi:acyl-CoA dehydrogenase family protein [Lentzea sp. BCCO 10_0856]|uniref:Acyl-CoA dehydrogenase family protein n=1 Tax=Lentzea miocenica TaxID=3095431 RepID=A0ABU4T6V1_9PSEU|nr:acyl-CoA dehydrogenase family protein [Lentzea sp. BCCO 10_0856]MDX8033835.1 acyl-CoA dehydrogenase family protein [Lentzea sp. BCCO 10_0856]